MENTDFPISESSPRMRDMDDAESRLSFRKNTAKLPFESISVGMSFAVPLDHSEASLRVRVSRENAKGKRKFKVIKWDACYEVGCVADPENVVSRETSKEWK